MVGPERLSWDLPSHPGGCLGLDPKSPCGPGIGPVVGSQTRFGKTRDSNQTTVYQIRSSLLFPFLVFPFCRSSPALSTCGEGAFTNGLSMPF